MTLPLQRPRRSGYGRVFLLCLALAAALFLPHCIVDGVSGSFFHYAGDFNDQMIPFYAYANDFVKRGGAFSWATDLGSGFVNAYSYYCLGSPFFLAHAVDAAALDAVHDGPGALPEVCRGGRRGVSVAAPLGKRRKLERDWRGAVRVLRL